MKLSSTRRSIAHAALLLTVFLLGCANPAPVVSQAPPKPAPNPESYKLGVGDVIDIRVYGEEALSVKAKVDESGNISYPFIGEIAISGLTLDEVRRKIIQGLKEGYLVSPDVGVFIDEYRPVFINGQVKAPGGYPYVPGLTVQKAVSLAGGFAPLASTNNMYVVRENDPNNERVQVSLDSELYPGDTLIVQEGLF